MHDSLPDYGHEDYFVPGLTLCVCVVQATKIEGGESWE